MTALALVPALVPVPAARLEPMARSQLTLAQVRCSQYSAEYVPLCRLTPNDGVVAVVN
jgi:hypothetical protein